MWYTGLSPRTCGLFLVCDKELQVSMHVVRQRVYLQRNLSANTAHWMSQAPNRYGLLHYKLFIRTLLTILFQIKPLSGPIEGGTLVTIEGSNLGLKESDVQGKIRIGDVPCELVKYAVSVRIQCITGPSKIETTAPIIVGNEAGYTESSVAFSYKDIRLSGIYPSTGPQAGGTQLAITGQYLNIGSEITAYLDDYVCQVNITQASSGRLTCITSKAHGPANIAKLTLSIDGANRTLEGNPFNYTQDPTIMEIKPLNSFVSGGKMIFVHGTNLDSIQKPEMEVYSYSEPNIPINKTVCTVLSATQMECPSPPVNRQFLMQSRASRVSRSLRKPAAMKVR